MARKAVKLSDSGIEPIAGKRGDELACSYQTVVVAQNRFIGGKRQNE